MLKIGAHVSVAKGLIAVLKNVAAMGGNCLQIFSSSPRSFGTPKFTDSQCSEFKIAAQKLNISPVFIHACYLINLGSTDEGLRMRSVKSLTHDLIFAEKIGAKGSIVHTGSHKGNGFLQVLPFVVKSLHEILKNTPASTKVYLEIAAGGSGKIGSTFAELKQMLDGADNKRVGVCLDTCHLFAGGMRFDTAENLKNLVAEIEKTVGWERIDCIHTNDSKGDFGSFIDRHENIGSGKIGTAPFKLLLHHPKFSRIPFIMEVPGFDGKGPDKKNIDILKSLL